MKLKKAREIVYSESQIIYAEHEKDIERKIKALRKRAGRKKSKETANNFREKATEWKTLLRANFFKRKEMSNVQCSSP